MKEKQQAIIEQYLDAYNHFDVAGMVKDLHEKVVFENVSNEQVTLRTEGIEQFKKQAAEATAYFTERKQSVKSWNFKNKEVCIEIDYEAVLAIELPNGLKPGDQLQLSGKSVFGFEGEQIIKIRDES